MTYTLRVEFRGLCMFVVDTRQDEVAVLMPDARDARMQRDPAAATPPDGKPADLHAAVLVCDLADVVLGPSDESGTLVRSVGVSGELVHQFHGETLTFALSKKPFEDVALAVPSFDEIVADPQLIDGLFDETPPPALVARTFLEGGSLIADATGPKWEFPGAERDGEVHAGNFAEHVTWTYEGIEGPIELRLKSWDPAAPGETTLTLAPQEGFAELRLRISNLCADNPLRWPEFGAPPKPTPRVDDDFRWFYRLLQPTGHATLPVPRLDPEDSAAAASRGSPPGCDTSRIGGSVSRPA